MKLKEQSLKYLKNYYIKNKYSLSKAKLKNVKKLLRKRIKENSKMSEEILDSTLFRLASVYLKQKNRSLLVVRNEGISQNYTDVIIEIINVGGERLIKYLKEEVR